MNVCGEQIFHERSYLFSPPIFTSLAVILDESGFDSGTKYYSELRSAVISEQRFEICYSEDKH